MTKFDHVVPDHIRALGGYVPGKAIKVAERESGVACIKMASNENPLGPSPRALEAMRRAAADINLYPDNEVTELRRRLAGRHQVDPSMILVTAGSTSFLTIIGRTLLAPGLNAITGEQSFIIYPIVIKSAGGRVITVPMCNFAYDLDAIPARIDADTRVVFIANPNNPTGTLLSPAEMDRFMERVPSHVCVVLDEAYSDFAQYLVAQRGVEYTHSLDYVRQGRNVVVLRTFSKAHGLAGARIGYGIATPELLEFFARMKTVFSVNTVAEAGALAALDDQAHIRRSLENNAAGVKWLTQQLGEMGLSPVPTWTNFIFIDVAEDAAQVAKRLQNEGIIVRPMTGAWGAPQAIRVTVGTPEQNAKFISALKAVMERAVVP